MTNRKIQYWVIPPEADAEFVACMEEVLDTYEKPYDPACPVLCMDEQPVQLVKETRQPIPATRQARRIEKVNCDQFDILSGSAFGVHTTPRKHRKGVTHFRGKTDGDFTHSLLRKRRKIVRRLSGAGCDQGCDSGHLGLPHR